MASYSVFCYAIDSQGMDIDQSFEISYNILWQLIVSKHTWEVCK
jgi:hypothetical protein